MFREMRLKKQSLSEAETDEMLRTCTSGILAVSGDNDYPYAVPLSYAYKDGKIYFHCAKSGHKLDGIRKNDKVSFCVIAADEVKAKAFTTYYRSAIVFGRARILTNDGEKRAALTCIAEKYSAGFASQGDAMIEKEWGNVCAVEIRVEHKSGKAASELLDQSSQE